MISVKRYTLPTVNTREVLRYMGCAKADTPTVSLLNDVLAECQDVFEGAAVCFCELSVRNGEDGLFLGKSRVESRDLSRALTGCERAVLFGATVGVGIDRLIARYSRVSPARAFCLQAVGAERVEALCDTFCADYASMLSKNNKILRPRFSAGYGDLALEIQKEWFRVLDCPKKIGLSLNESLVMSPSKSVTAIAGILKNGNNDRT